MHVLIRRLLPSMSVSSFFFSSSSSSNSFIPRIHTDILFIDYMFLFYKAYYRYTG